jgi:LPS-assembly protein
LAAAAALWALAAGVQAQSLPRVHLTPPPQPAKPASSAEATPTVTLTADDVVSHIGNVTQASGKVVVQRLDMTLRADLLTYDQLSDTVHAQGNARVERGLDWFMADRVDLELTRDAGTLTGTQYELGARKAGGHAQRIELIDRDRSTAYNANYTSCTRDGTGDPDWIISGDKIDIDTSTNEGKAHHAVLRFLGVPILAAPSLTFPVTSERKSGWLPPTGDLSTRSGFSLSAPYYWNVAPNIDATLSAGASTRRGAELAGELRYLQPNDLGQVTAYLLPDDVSERHTGIDTARGAVEWAHEGTRSDWLTYSARLQRVSDSAYWVDFPGQMPSLTQRMLPTDLSGTRRFLPFGDAGEIDAYARVERFQTLQEPPNQRETDGLSVIPVPFQRSPQIGVRGNLTLQDQLRFDMEAEGDRFDLSDRPEENNAIGRINALCTSGNPNCLTPLDTRVGGARAHFIASVSRSFSSEWGRFEPKLQINGTTYNSDIAADGTRVDSTRWVPTLSGDSSFSFERQTELFGRELVQTLEPRFLYVLTPRRNQFALPLYDTAPKDFNEVSIYSTNEFTGNDRISDENQLTAGVATRYNDAVNGRELLRLGIAQKFLFSKQWLTTSNYQDTTDQTPPPYARKLSDLLLYGSSSAMEHWSFDGIVELDPFRATGSATAPATGTSSGTPTTDVATSGGNTSSWTVQRAVVSARFHPGPFKTMSLTYRFASGTNGSGGASKQFEVGGQWPVYHQPPRANGCGGTLYAVGRVDYSVTDSRATYAIGGVEYDAGCWIGRVLVERTSTGSQQSTTHLVLQLELNGLSTLGTGSLRVLSDNVPGYQPLRNDPGATAASQNSQ